MKVIKKFACIIIFAFTILSIYSTTVKAATVTVTANSLNLREKASTSSKILTTLSKNEKCEIVEEDGDWYKVKYNSYTGYVSKDYVKENKETSISSEQGENEPSSGSSTSQITGKVSKKTNMKLVPLIYSSNIDTISKNTKLIILSEMNGWAYVQTDSITGWIRSDVITNKKTVTIDVSIIDTTTPEKDDNNTDEDTNTVDDNQVAENNTVDNDTTSGDKNQTSDNKDNDDSTDKSFKEKTMYINDSYVNLRKGPSTSTDVIMTVAENTKLTVIGESGEWYKVKTKSSGNAYVLKKLLSDNPTSSSRGGQPETTTNSKVDDTSDATNKVTVAQSTTTNTSNAVPNKSTKGQEVVNYAKKFLGVPYVYGGASKSGFDCSGFTMYVYKKFGISMRHGAQAQAKLGKAVKADKTSASSLKKNLQPGDLVFFLDYETMDEIGHCGIYIGDGKFIHASSGSGYCVKINSLLPGEYYNTRYCAARRVL